MIALTLKSWNLSLWNGLARVVRQARLSQTVDVERLSAHILSDLGISRHDSADLLAAERTRFLN